MLPSDSIGTAWRTLANFSAGAAPTLRLSEFGVGELRKRVLQRLIAPPQRVVIGVGNDRRVLAMVAPVVLGDFRAEAACSARAASSESGSGGGLFAGMANVYRSGRFSESRALGSGHTARANAMTRHGRTCSGHPRRRATASQDDKPHILSVFLRSVINFAAWMAGLVPRLSGSC